MNLKEVKPKPTDLDWAKRGYMNLSIKQNPLEPITSFELDLSLPHGS
jgi:hypothetical protein